MAKPRPSTMRVLLSEPDAGELSPPEAVPLPSALPLPEASGGPDDDGGNAEEEAEYG